MTIFSRLVANERTALLTPVVGLIAQGIFYTTIFFGAVLFSIFDISTDNLLFELLIIVLAGIPVIGFFGLYAAIHYIKSNGSSVIAKRGIIYNLLYLVSNVVLYSFIYFISKYGASV